jgi:phosphoglycolate phosphatase-like HAD superfamily hydrolase
MPLLITDLDNTLYDWVTYYAQAFRALVDVLVEDLGVGREKLLDEFKAVHQMHGDSEYPLAMFELPAVRRSFKDLSEKALRRSLDRALRAFEHARAEYLRPYDSVERTLESMHVAGVVIVGHTEAMAENAFIRLRHLGIASRFRRLYALEGRSGRYADPRHLDDHPGASDLIQLVPRSERKPNPQLVLDICRREGVKKEDAWYVGDSLTRDVSMARIAGVRAVWARYGTIYSQELWNSLVRVTHWSDEDVRREVELRKLLANVQPDFVIDSFSELLGLMSIA